MVSASEKLDDVYKIVLIGDSHVGKTTFLSRYISDQQKINRSKINDMEAKIEVIGRRKIDVQVWDLSGDPSYRVVSGIYFKKALGAFALFDIANHASFASVESWINDLRNENPDCNIMIIGNKSDLRLKLSQAHVVSVQEANALAAKVKVPYKEVSSLKDEDVMLAFKEMIKSIDADRSEESVGNWWIYLGAGVILLIGVMFYMF